MALPLALANQPWDVYLQPIRLPEGEDDQMTDDENPTPPPYPSNSSVDNNDEGTCLLHLLQQSDTFADFYVGTPVFDGQHTFVDEDNTAPGVNTSNILNSTALQSLSKLLKTKGAKETALLLSTRHGLPLHSVLLSRSTAGVDLLTDAPGNVHELVLSDDTAEDMEQVLLNLQDLLLECYGGPGYRAATRLHLLRILENNEKADGIIKCGEEMYPVHKFLLAHRSDFFRAAFNRSNGSNHTKPSNTVESSTVGGSGGNGGGEPICVIEMPNDFLTEPGLFKLLLKYCYTLHQTEMDALLSNPDFIVQVAYSADLLMLPKLKEAALDRMVDAVDSLNAPSLLHVAQNLDHDKLRRQCIAHMVKHLKKVAREAPHFGQVIGAKEYDWLKRLSEASISNPVSCGAILTDEREYIAMLSEALDAQRIQFCEATSRQQEEMFDLKEQEVQAQKAESKSLHHQHQSDSVFHDVAKRLRQQVEARRSRLSLVETSLEAQSRHIEFLDDFLKTTANAAAQARAFSESSQKDMTKAFSSSLAASDVGSGASDEDTNKKEIEEEIFIPGQFTPTYEWQVIQPNQAIPTGLDIRVNISAGIGGEAVHSRPWQEVYSPSPLENHHHLNARRARIPPVWRLKVWIEWQEEDEDGGGVDPASSSSSAPPLFSSKNRANRYHRQDVRKDDTTGLIEATIAKAENIDKKYVKLIFFDTSNQQEYHLSPATTFEPFLFIHQRELKVVIGSSPLLDQQYPEVYLRSQQDMSNHHYLPNEAYTGKEEENGNNTIASSLFVLPVPSPGEAAIP